EQVSLMNDLLKSLKTLNINGAEVSIAHASADYYVADAASLAHMIRDMENLDALFLVVDMGKRIYIVGRSRLAEVDAGAVLAELGGGGHATAASATVRDMTLIEALRRLEEVLRDRVNPARCARDLMSSPVKTIPAATPLADAREILTRYNINAMPVMEQGEMRGIITRRTVEKALYHGLGDLPVSEYMSTDFMKAAPDTPIAEVQEYIVGHDRRFVPVFEDGELAGAITRTDLLRYMYGGLRSRDERAYDLATRESRMRRRDMAQIMSQVLSRRVLQVFHDLGNVGKELDLPVYAVGGFVRDLLLGTENTDIDVTVEGDGILFAETFASRFGCRVKSHRKFETAVIVFPDGFKVDVASTRLEYYETPGALPTVERSSLKMDLYRRDFTINTLAVRLDGPHFGALIDYFGGRRDIRDRVIRVLHNLSFVEDPTRVFRAIRFELRLGFRVSAHTENLITNAVRMNFLEKLGGKRLLAELIHIFRVNDPVDAVDRMGDLGLLRFIHPDLQWDREARGVMDEARKVADWFQLLFLDRPCELWGVYFLALTAGLEQEAFEGACMRLALVEHFGGRLPALRREGLAVLRRLAEGEQGHGPVANSEVYFALRDLPAEILLYLMAVTRRTGVKKMISLYFTHLQEVTLSVGGEDLRDLGLKPGPVYRKILDRLLTERLNGAVATREEELRLAEELAGVFQMQHPGLQK
ncbi:MAG TPA: CBS domain-containing protein, partial [Verrucomicrobiae bacterium]|nr:CBS domain-containing protein [Verrucomicrobiae bacterium]